MHASRINSSGGIMNSIFNTKFDIFCANPLTPHVNLGISHSACTNRSLWLLNYIGPVRERKRYFCSRQSLYMLRAMKLSLWQSYWPSFPWPVLGVRLNGIGEWKKRRRQSMFFPWLSLSQATTNRMPGTDYHLQFQNLLPLNYKMSIHLLMSRWTFGFELHQE